MNTFTIKDALGHGWNRFRQDPWVLVLTTIIFLLPSLPLEKLDQSEGSLSILIQIVLTVISLIFTVGFMSIAIRREKGEKTRIADIVYRNPKTIVRFLLTELLYGALLIVAMIPFIIPFLLFPINVPLAVLAGILCFLFFIMVAVRYWFYPFSLLEREAGVLDALKDSWTITHNHTLKLVGFTLVSIIINVVGILLLGVGILVTLPVTTIAVAYVYRKLENTRETLPISDQSELPMIQ